MFFNVFIHIGGKMFTKTKIVRLAGAALGVLLLILCIFFIFRKPTLGQKMSINYTTDSNFEIKNCKRELGYLQKLIGAYDNVSYCMNFPIFDDKKWNNVVFEEISDKVYCYKKSRLSSNLINDKFELFSNYQTFKFGENDENVSIQMQFYEKNLTKKKDLEILKTFVFSGDELVDEKKFFKRSEFKKVIDEIRKVFVENHPKYRNTDLSKILPYSFKTLHNFVVTNNSVIFFYERGQLLPKSKIISIEVDRSKIEDFIKYKKASKLSDAEKAKPMVALTFDDGPDGEKTEELLETLKENGARATFFVVGKQAEKYPKLLKKMVDYDCEIGNHTYSHPNLNSLSERDLNNEINKTNKIVEHATDGYRPSLMRPPGNNCNNKVKNMLTQPIIIWSIDTLDWKHRNTAKTIDAALNHVNDGSIILMHDIHKETVEAAKVIIPKLIEKGFALVTVSEMAELKGEQLNPHTKYSRIRKAVA